MASLLQKSLGPKFFFPCWSPVPRVLPSSAWHKTAFQPAWKKKGEGGHAYVLQGRKSKVAPMMCQSWIH